MAGPGTPIGPPQPGGRLVGERIIGAQTGRRWQPFSRYRSHMPKGGTLSPKGDLGMLRVKEGDTQRNFKNRGKGESAAGYLGSNVGQPGKMGEKD